MKVAAVQMVSGASLEANLAQARSLLSQACDSGAELAVLPEYFAAMGHRDQDKLAHAEALGNGPVQDFLADAGDVLVAPGGTGTRIGDTDPGGGVVVEVGAAFGVVGCSLPVELDLDSAVGVGEDFFAFGADDGGGGQSFGRRLLVCCLRVFGNEGDVAADSGEGVSVGWGGLLRG